MGIVEEEMASPSHCCCVQEIGIEEREERREFENESPWNLEEIEEIVRYTFNDKSLLEEAFTHGSIFYISSEKPYPCCKSYKRLEYVGDSVLNFSMSKHLFLKYPDLLPGQLTNLRAANFSNEKLARLSVKHGLHRYIRHKAPTFYEQIREFSKEILDYPMHSNGLINTPKFLASIVKSTIGAVFRDSNYSLDTVWKVFEEFSEPMITPDTLGMHPKTELLEFCQKKGLLARFNEKKLREGRKTVNVFVDEQLVGTATYRGKKEIVQNRAAKAALDKLKSTLAYDKQE